MSEDRNLDPTKQKNPAGSSDQDEGKILDIQTLENLAAFLSRDNDEKNEQSNEPKTQNQNLDEAEEPKPDYDDRSPSPVEKEKNDSRSLSRSRSRSAEKSTGRWLYCCGKCKKNDKKGKTCVCVVPATQRRVSLVKEGCSTCNCNGCSKEDIQARDVARDSTREKTHDHEHEHEADDKRTPDYDDLQSLSEIDRLRNGCCRECMKAFSAANKACICQVPSTVRRRKLPDNGCVICGCHGCNPEDMRKRLDSREKESSQTREEIPLKIKKRGQKDDEYSPDDNQRRFDEPEETDVNLNNFDNSYFGNFMRSSFSIYPPLLGFGVPQRTYSYIFGKPPPSN